ncbi:MAG: hypothetical protein M0031_03300 [Thermaerobacter sp.]|jgi:hypothetical protein|nr:hypothetical protein [Thermaerobacter sp.]
MEQRVRGGEDLIFRSMSRLLRDEFIQTYGLEAVEVVAPAPTDIPFIVGERRVDNLFRLADGVWLHLEFQSRPVDLARFLVYDALLHERDRCPVRTVVVYTGGLRRASEAVEAGSLSYRVRNVFMYRFDGEAVLTRVEAELAAGRGLSRQDLLDVIFSPCMRQPVPPGEATLRAVELARRIPDEAERIFCLGAIIGLGDKFLSEEQAVQVREVLRMTRVGEMLREEGREEGRRADVLLILERRFGTVSPEVAGRVRRQKKEAVLEELLLAAATAGSMTEFASRLERLGAEE